MPAKRTARRATRGGKKSKTGRSDPCIKCGKVLSRQSDMKRHMRRHGKRQFKCEECKFASHTPCGLKVHIRTQHTGEKDYCPFDGCLYATGDPALMYRHKRNVHPEFVPATRAATIPTAAAYSGNESFSYRHSSPFRPPIDTLSDLSALSPLTYSDAGSPGTLSSIHSEIPSSPNTNAMDIHQEERYRVAYASMEEMNRPRHSYMCEEQLQYPNTMPFNSFSYQTTPGYEAVGFPAEFHANQVCNSFMFPPLHTDDIDISSPAYGDLTVDPTLLGIDEYLKAASMMDALDATSPFNKDWPSTLPQSQSLSSPYFDSWGRSVQSPFVPTGNIVEFDPLAVPCFSPSMDFFASSL
ncbi:hypothetical protein JR316_0011989 [Psilocybe cubensis]|uniref:Uncharacterized protein n=2 Tax=Psilocybe cubensis TaxID=181762 RepID=A0ACB8GLR9_PSICU|nr:hypothetical protein JR316_0011989 [Psilocybe cubensis]KAH9476414.1 hypothetical protein JR316_0011989 [Psilocybe cubensis]